MEYNCALIKVNWLANCIALRVVGAVFVIFPPELAYNLLSPPANGRQEPIPEEMYQTLLTKKRGNLDQVNATKTLLSHREKYTFCIIYHWST